MYENVIQCLEIVANLERRITLSFSLLVSVLLWRVSVCGSNDEVKLNVGIFDHLSRKKNKRKWNEPESMNSAAVIHCVRK